MKKIFSFIVFLFFSCSSTQKSNFEISHFYEGKNVYFDITQNGKKMELRHIDTLGSIRIIDKKDYEPVWFIVNVASDSKDLARIQYGSIPVGFLKYKNYPIKPLQKGKKYSFYFIPIVPAREFHHEFVYDPDKKE